MKRGIALLMVLMISVVFITNPFGICNRTSAYYVNSQTIKESSIYAPVQATQGSMLTVTGNGILDKWTFSGWLLSNSNATTQLQITDILVTLKSPQPNQKVDSISLGATYFSNTAVAFVDKTVDIKPSTSYYIDGGVKNIPMTIILEKKTNGQETPLDITFIMSDGSQKIIRAAS